MTPRARRIVGAGALLIGVGLFALAVQRIDFRSLMQAPRQIGLAFALALVPSAAWHVLRTAAWQRAFPPHARVSFAHAFRVRLAAEAFSYVTVSGLAGDPLKVVMLDGRVPASIAASAVALERLAFLIVTALILATASFATLANLTLERGWVLAYMAIAVAALMVAAVIVWLLLRRRAPSAPKSTVARFVRRLALDARELAGHPRRLAALFAFEAGAYVMMVAEVWTILTATGTSVAWGSALAIETFTRAASLVSGFIPANLGALEMSNVAAAAAMNAAAGAAVLALVRRLRGLAWCAAGFLIYPRQGAGPRRAERPLVVVDDGDRALLVSARLGGWSAGERVVRAAARAGYTRLFVWTPPNRQPYWARWSQRCAPAIELVTTYDTGEWRRQLLEPDHPGVFTVLAPGTVASPALLEAALGVAPDPDDDRAIVEVPAGPEHPHSGVFRAAIQTAARPDWLADALAPAGDRLTPPEKDVSAGQSLLSVHVSTERDRADAECRLRASIIKPTDGRAGRFNRRLSIPLSVVLIRYFRLSPNVMSVTLTLLGVYAGWLFSRGAYASGVVAALLSLASSVLDGCDGELARLQYRESALGCWLDTIGDYVYYVVIFAGITAGVARDTRWPGFVWIGAALGVGMLLTFGLLILLRWRITAGRPEQLRTRARRHFDDVGKRWTRIAVELATVATRATMPYGILAFAVLGLLPALVVIAAFAAQVYWIGLATQIGALLRNPNPPLSTVGTRISVRYGSEP